mgnify:CR=1 FL=1
MATNKMKINQTNSLNKKARKFLLANCVSKRGAEIKLFGFNGYLNGNEVQDITLIRKNSKWEVFNTTEKVLSISGMGNLFSLTINTIS